MLTNDKVGIPIYRDSVRKTEMRMRAFLKMIAVFGLALTTATGQGTGLASTSAVFGEASSASPLPPPGMARVPSGRYTPLFRGEKDPREVTVDAFLLDVAPVTNAEYLEF